MRSFEPARAAPGVLRGIGLSALGYSLFSVQDAVVKWLVAGYAVPQILFTRSLVIVVFAGAIGGRRDVATLARSPNKRALVARAALILTAWLLYYSAAPRLGLAELTTLYFEAPVVAVVLAVLILAERVGRARWLAVLGGFAGVVIAADPSGRADLVPVGMALLAACCWGLSVVLVRLISRSESTANQMLISNALFALACAVVLPWLWRTPDWTALALMLGLGVAGGLGQFFLYEGFRLAPASVVAPIEYTGLVWAFLYGDLIWADVPRLNVFIGAGLIVASSLLLIWFEARRSPDLVRMPKGDA